MNIVVVHGTAVRVVHFFQYRNIVILLFDIHDVEICFKPLREISSTRKK